jgi:hypothetical protein
MRVRERCSVAMSFSAAACIFTLFLAAGAVLVRAAVVFLGPWDELLISVAITIPLVLAYSASRAAFAVIRWKRVDDDGRFCATCGYNLTGNLSGVCPECGTPVT